MTDPTFTAAIVRHPWIVEPDPFSYIEPGWSALFEATLDRVGTVMARHPGVVVRGLYVKEKFGTLRVHSFTRLPAVIESEVSRLWRDAEARSEHLCSVCGGPGRLRQNNRGWWITACDEHAPG